MKMFSRFIFSLKKNNGIRKSATELFRGGPERIVCPSSRYPPPFLLQGTMKVARYPRAYVHVRIE